MGLFSRLLKLYPLYGETTPREDFFTEIIAYFFDASNDLLYAWLESLNLFGPRDYTRVEVQTQVAFAALESHTTSNRPDILIKLHDGPQCDWVMIESKIDSGEGRDQLKRYAEILAAQPEVRGKVLLYITHHYDPKDAQKIRRDIPATDVQFKQLRWHHLYQFLRKWPSNALLDELLTFMEENGMAQETQFTAMQSIALVNIYDALHMMDATMSDRVCVEFKKVMGGNVKKSFTDKLRHLRWNRYCIYAHLNGNWGCGFGYTFWHGKTIGYPSVYLWIEVAPQSPRREEIIDAMKKICIDHKWRGFELDNKQAYANISKIVSLEHFLSSEDHVAAIEAFFLERIAEVALLKQEYPTLPWEFVAQESAPEEEE